MSQRCASGQETATDPGGGGGGGHPPGSEMNSDSRTPVVMYDLPFPGLKRLCPRRILMPTGELMKNMLVSPSVGAC